MLKSLKFKTMTIMVLVILIPLVSLGIVSLMRFTDATETAVESLLNSSIDLTSKLIKTELEKAHMVGSLLSSNTQFIEFASGQLDLQNTVYETLVETQIANSNAIEMLIITNANGRSITGSNDKNTSIDVKDRAYVQTALSGSPGQSSVIISKATNAPVIAIAYPLKKNDRVVGTLIATVTFENISKHARAIKVFEDGYAYLFDTSGLVLSHIDPTFEFNKNLNEFGIPELLPMVQDIVNQKGGETFYTYNDDYKYVRYEPIGDLGLAITANYDDYMSTLIRIRNFLLILIFISLAIAITVAYIYITHSITKPLSALSSLMARAGEGDLTVKSHIKSKDEIQNIGDSFNKMLTAQNSIVSSVKIGALEVARSSDDIASSTGDVSDASQNIAKAILEVADNSTSQSASVLETSETLLQLSSLIQMAKARAVEARKNVEQSFEVADKGRESVTNTIQAIVAIQESTKTTDQHLNELESLSAQITGISETINAIAAQTNLLALNASIEAARAGEHGKGFAVVAEEVRKLAEQTGREAGGITKVVNEMIDRIEKAVESMNKGSIAVQSGVEKSQYTDKAFLQILSAVRLISDDVLKIVEVTDDEVSSSERILKLIDSVAKLSDSNNANSQDVASAVEEQTALIETIAAASEQLTAMAHDLNHKVEHFKVKEDTYEN